jgi:hypothetical protein
MITDLMIRNFWSYNVHFTEYFYNIYAKVYESIEKLSDNSAVLIEEYQFNIKIDSSFFFSAV